MSNVTEDILEHSKDTNKGKLNIGKILNIPEERFSLNPFIYTISFNLTAMDKPTVIASVITAVGMLLCGYIWGTQGYIGFTIYLCAAVLLAIAYMYIKLNRVKQLPEELSESMNDGTLILESQYMVSKDKKSKHVLNDLATIVSFLHYESIYELYKNSPESSAASYMLMIVFLSSIVYVTASYTLAYLVGFYLVVRTIYELLRLRYIRVGIVYVAIFNLILKEKIEEKTNSNSEVKE